MTSIAELEIIELIDFDAEVTCESSKGCSNEPVWRATTICCNASANLCDDHKINEEAMGRRFLKVLGSLMCLKCKKIHRKSHLNWIRI